MNITHRITRLLLAALVLVLSLMLMGAAAKPMEEHPGVHELQAKLRGSSEVPGPGDPDGLGKAKITLIMEGHQVCWELKVKKILLPASAAHIHVGPEGVSGLVVVPLSAPNSEGVSSGCAVVDHELHMNLHMHPELYYVNVHNSAFPGGAIRGQLKLQEE